jgi:hypothetical protein
VSQWVNSEKSIHFGFPSQCVSIGKLLYLDVGPLGLKDLDTGDDLLLVTRQGHIHLNELTRGEDRGRREFTK